jgi:DNA polymerase V
MVVFAHTSRFKEELTAIHATLFFPVATNNTIELTQQMLYAMRMQWKPNTPYKRAGVILMDFDNDSGIQQQLFDTRNRERDTRLQEAIDKVNSQFGKRTLTLVTQLADERSRQLLDVGQKSPAYTTRLSDIIVLHC